MDIRQIHQHVENMRMRCTERDKDSYLVRMVRKGRMHELYPGHFADDMPQMTIANTIDNAARDIAEQIAPLPSVTCSSGNMSSQADVTRAAKRNKVASYYWDRSHLKRQNVDFADSLLSYAFGSYLVEPDFDNKCPRIRWENSFDTYYYKDRFDRMVWWAKYTVSDVLTLCAKYEQHAPFISLKGGRERSGGESERVVTYMDGERSVVYLPDCNYLVLAEWVHNLGTPMARVAERPGQEADPRGQFDDSVFPMLAKHVMTMYQMNAADKAINAPIAMPDDVTEMPYGPDATIRTQNPSQIARVRLDIPDDVFAVNEQLDKAVKEGSRYPETRGGGVTGNIITGKGIDALAGTMNGQVKTLQEVVGLCLEEITELCFMLDVKLWPNEQKTITGVLTGKPYEVTYTPAKDIGTSYTCKVSYGFQSGQTASQAIITLLQLLGGGTISQDTFRRQMPFEIDPDEEQRQIDVEGGRQALWQGLKGLEQAIGPMAMQGGDPLQVLNTAAKAIALRAKGVSIEDAMIRAFTPPEKPEGNVTESAENVNSPGPNESPGQPPGPGGPELPPGVNPNGMTQGVPYGQQGNAPGGMPAIASLLASVRGNGSVRTEATVSRKRAIGAG